MARSVVKEAYRKLWLGLQPFEGGQDRVVPIASRVERAMGGASSVRTDKHNKEFQIQVHTPNRPLRAADDYTDSQRQCVVLL